MLIMTTWAMPVCGVAVGGGGGVATGRLVAVGSGVGAEVGSGGAVAVGGAVAMRTRVAVEVGSGVAVGAGAEVGSAMLTWAGVELGPTAAIDSRKGKMLKRNAQIPHPASAKMASAASASARISSAELA
jgi:hypothetical protein